MKDYYAIFARNITLNDNGCLVWLGSLNEKGYGRIGYKGKSMKAHRFAWMLFRGPIPEGMMVTHECDNPLCVNPEHLSLGDHKKNMRDKAIRERSHNLKIANKDVLEIIEALKSRSEKEIAFLHDVHPSTISKIKHRVRRSHIQKNVTK